jgi:hypothetical protein
LLAALRHAPDRDVVPPMQLTDAILGQARQAVRRPGARAWQERVHEFFGRLWQPAPMAAFGTLAMATLIGVMWGTQEWPGAAPSLRSEPAAPAAAPASAPSALNPSPPAPAPRAAKAAPKPATQVAPVGGVLASDGPPPPRAARDDAQRESAIAREVTSAVQTPAVVTARAPAMATTPEIPPQPEALTPPHADAAPASARMRTEVARSAAGAAGPAGNSPLAGPSREIEGALMGDASRLRWRVAAQRLVAHGNAQRDWWQALAVTTEGRWQPVTPVADVAAVTLVIDGVPRGSLAFDAQAVIWRDPGGATWRAALAPNAVRALQESVARW